MYHATWPEKWDHVSQYACHLVWEGEDPSTNLPKQSPPQTKAQLPPLTKGNTSGSPGQVWGGEYPSTSLAEAEPPVVAHQAVGKEPLKLARMPFGLRDGDHAIWPEKRDLLRWQTEGLLVIASWPDEED